ncbi:short chain dehydrogenase [Talaromyces proteolyticus]|uniref:Short chain dehydrogenase n=1 Tax=Talaromyces proteolyticus TaxID=1131652 RepID=A0AAD4KIA3_9EURO|nr:short chain dehydrogenase [Talaromyces proteolyticus]KAH8691882.1 short chain dehydrogenase [Talaromyces proteolyticus]
MATHQRIVDDSYKTPIQTHLNYKDKTAVVTGGARGIGLALARQVAELGGNVAVLDYLSQPDDEFDELEKTFGIKARFYQTDVTKKESLEQSFAEVVAEFGRIDGCVTAAGIVYDAPFLGDSWENVIRAQMVNVVGTYFSAQLAARQMEAQGTGGSIVMIASICAHQTLPTQHVSSYSASKGAVKSLGHALAVELGPKNIRVNTISPGYIYTAMIEGVMERFPSLAALMRDDPPLGRIGNRADIKGAVAYYLSDASSYVTGNDILVTGGLHVGRSNPPTMTK